MYPWKFHDVPEKDLLDLDQRPILSERGSNGDQPGGDGWLRDPTLGNPVANSENSRSSRPGRTPHGVPEPKITKHNGNHPCWGYTMDKVTAIVAETETRNETNAKDHIFWNTM